ncbi:DUF6538 domain-containing protein [Brevundimonas sp. BH3]|uniref:DUF6538 domain-containing protein n=1 Tax=Brevundimonas sp. BH3 TaxID=3133089 RepID=UPI00324A34AC
MQNATENPPSGPFADDCPTTLPHNGALHLGLSHSSYSANRQNSVYTNRLHNVRTHFVQRYGRIYYRRRVPAVLQGAIGKKEVWRSLGTDSLTVAKRRALSVAADVEWMFETARAQIGHDVDPVLLARSEGRFDGVSGQPVEPVSLDRGMTLGDVYDAYMNDPTRNWSPTTRMAYQTTRRLVVAILGEDTPVTEITRTQCRDMIEVLRWQPRNASKLFPKLSPIEIAELAKREGRTDLINAANINTYLNKLGGVFNWAVAEELLDRNPAKGLRVPDPTARRDKRRPFSTNQLQAIFAAPLYTGCRDDGHGYATVGTARPRNARFWIPLLSLFAGLRLNEACQLDVADVRNIDGVYCLVISERSDDEQSDKRLKTSASERTVPLHAQLMELGFIEFVSSRKRAGEVKLFGEVAMGATGYRSTTFSAWFRRFVVRAGAASEKTCFHSFRHCFRDALREAMIDRDVAMTLGGWSISNGASVSDVYGNGYRLKTLKEEIDKIKFIEIDFSKLKSE